MTKKNSPDDENMKSYLKFLSRNKLYTAIEAVGLIVSLAFVLLTGLIAFVSVIWQVLKAAKTNPAIELKKE